MKRLDSRTLRERKRCANVALDLEQRLRAEAALLFPDVSKIIDAMLLITTAIADQIENPEEK